MKKRIITGVCLTALIFLAIFILNTPLFALFCGLVLLIGAWEWLSFSNYFSTFFKINLIILMILLMLASWFYLSWVIPIGVFIWVLAIVLILIPMTASQFLKRPFYLALFAFCILIPAWAGIVFLHSEPNHWGVIYILMISVLADTGAYFSGKFFGKHKMAPQVSPKKTLEGAFGGIVLASVLSSLFFEFLGQTSRASFWDFLLISIGLVFVSIFGDLFESLLKRHCGVKDSGNILPGHGGVLDRIDSVIAILPVFACIEISGRFFGA